VSETIRELTVQISANGASTAQKDIKGLQNAVAQADAKFRAAGAGIKNFEKTTAGMQARVTMLSEKLTAQKGVVDKAAAALDKARTKMQAASDSQQKLAQKVDTARAAYEKEVAASGKNSEASKALAADLQKLEGQYAAQAKSAQNAAQNVQKGETALTNAQAAVKGTEAELKKANTTLQKHGSAWAQAGQKVAAAGEKFTAAGKKMSSAGRSLTTGITVPVVAAGVAAYKAWDTMDSGLDTVIRKTGATGAALVPLEAAYNNVFLGVKTTAEDAGIAVGKVNTRFKATGTELEELSKTFIQFADVNEADLNASIGKTAKVFAQWKEPASAAKGFLGLLTSESQRTGISVDKLMDTVQTNGATLKGMNLSLSQSVQFMADFEAAGVNADTALAALKKSAVQYTKDGRTLEQGFAMTVKAIQGAKDETTALAIAQKVFGAKGALEMATAIREGRLSVTGLSADMSNMGDVVGKTFAEINGDTANLDRAKNKIIAAGASLGKSQILPWVEKAAEKVGQALDSFAGIDPAIQQNIISFVAFGAATGPVLSGLGKIATGAGALMKLFAGPAGWVTIAVGALAGLGAWIGSIKSPIDQMKEKLKNIKVGVDSSAVQQFTNDMQAGIDAANKLNEIKIAVQADTTKLSEAIEQVFSDNKFTSKEKKFLANTLTKTISPDIDAAKLALQGMTGNAKKATEALLTEYDTAYGNFNSLLSTIYAEKRTPTEAEIAKLNEYLVQIEDVRVKLQAANVEAVAAAQAQYNLTAAGRGDEKTAAAAFGLVKGTRNQEIANAQAEQKKALAESAGDLDKAAKANEDFAKKESEANQKALASYQELIDGIAKSSDAETMFKTIAADMEALSAVQKTLSTYSATQIDGLTKKGSELKAITDALKDPTLAKYLSLDDAATVAKLAETALHTNYWEGLATDADVNAGKAILERLNEQLGTALQQNAKDPKLNPVLKAVQSLFDNGALEGIDLASFTGVLEDAITTMNLPKLFEDSGADAGASLAGGITASTPGAVTAIHDMYAAMIAEANIMKPRLAAAMSLVTGGGGTAPGGGRYGSPTYNSTANLNIQNYSVASANDTQILMDNMNILSKNKLAAYGRRPNG
jgi:phage-related minor tail protein